MRPSLLLASVSLLCACSRTPDHRLGFPGEDPRSVDAVRITELGSERVEVENTGKNEVTIDGVGLENGWGGVLTIDPDATGCVPGLTLRSGEYCLVTLVFEPANDITYRDSLLVDYLPGDGDAADARRASLGVSATGLLDCSLTDEWASSYGEGVAEADAQIAVDIAEATAAGEALTRDDGYSDGYAAAYAAAYDLSYTRAYDDGLAQGYDDGYAEGASPAACREGEGDGYADGVNVGLVDGEADGALDGDAAGYNDGYNNGAFDGEIDSCGSALKIDPDPSLPGKCVDRGYTDTYSRSYYDDAFDAAVAANADYQDGLALGELEGDSAGRVDGDAEGYAEGYRVGADAGFVDGDADQYEACYTVAYNQGYEDGYLDGYDALFALTYDSAYATGYNDGYAAGLLVCG